MQLHPGVRGCGPFFPDKAMLASIISTIMAQSASRRFFPDVLSILFFDFLRRVFVRINIPATNLIFN
jgi:hypothetical protein